MSLKGKLRKTDWLGTSVLMIGSAFLIMAMNFGGSVFAWDSAKVIAFWVMTGVFLILMVLVTWFHPFVSKEDRLYPAHFVKRFDLVNLQFQIFMISGLMFVSSIVITRTEVPANLYKDTDILFASIFPVYKGRSRWRCTWF